MTRLPFKEIKIGEARKKELSPKRLKRITGNR